MDPEFHNIINANEHTHPAHTRVNTEVDHTSDVLFIFSTKWKQSIQAHEPKTEPRAQWLICAALLWKIQ